MMFSQWVEGGVGGQPEPDVDNAVPAGGVGILTTVPAGPPTPSAPVAYASFAPDYPGEFFDKIILLPRTKVEFGNILTLVQKTYELYSSFRNTTVTLSAVINNAVPGVTLPDLTVPQQVEPGTSILDPTSTSNDGGAGLGTLVLLTADAAADGLPVFDTSIVFNFLSPANDGTLLVSGTRVVLIPYEFESDVRESLAFLTDVIPARSGKEQRIALRKNPRQGFRVVYDLDTTDRQGLQVLLFDWMGNVFGLPLWHEKLLTTAAVSVGATLYSVTGGDDVDFRVGGLGVVITDALTFDVLQISAVSDTLITASDPSLNAYPAGTKIMPVRTARLRGDVPTRRNLVALEKFVALFDVEDNDTGAPTGSTTPGFWSLYNSRVLFDDCNVAQAALTSGKLVRRVHVVDNQTGQVSVTSKWPRNKREGVKGFVGRNRAEIMEIRKLWIALRGRQKAFYLPTDFEDLTPVAGVTISTVTLDIHSIGFVRFVRDRLPWIVLRVTFTDGTSLERDVDSSATVSPSVERLTLVQSWPATRTLAEFQRIQLFDLSRSAADEMVLQYERNGLARTRVPTLSVFDDDP